MLASRRHIQVVRQLTLHRLKLYYKLNRAITARSTSILGICLHKGRISTETSAGQPGPTNGVDILNGIYQFVLQVTASEESRTNARTAAR